MAGRVRQSRHYMYPPCDDRGTKQHLEAVDFSQAFRTTQLGNCLCFTNPLRQRSMERIRGVLEREKRRCDASAFYNQRAFFMNQVLDKGLNLYRTSHACASGTSSPAASLLPKMPTPEEFVMAREQPLEDGVALPALVSDPACPSPTHGASKSPSKTVPTQKETASTVANRAGEMADGGSQRTRRQTDKLGGQDTETTAARPASAEGQTDQQRHEKDAKKQPRLALPTLCMPRLPYARLSPQHKVEEEMELPATPASPASSRASKISIPRRPEKKTIASLRKDLTSIFPKMNRLIDEGPEEPEEIMERVYYKPNDPKLRRAAPARAVTSEAARESAHVLDVKHVQRLTANLPQHAVARAEEQIREMSNTQSIRRLQDKLKEKNRARMVRGSLQDARWAKLEKRLCSTHGIHLSWRKVQQARWMLS